MRHLAVPAMSRDGKRPYTATGLGDRIHFATLAWIEAPAVLHLTRAQVTGGQFGNKPESWAEIVSLFPEGAISVQAHDYEPKSNRDWLDYLQIADLPTYGRWEFPLLKAKPFILDLPERFYTAQWDANGPSRCVTQPPAQDLPTVIVGGQAEGALRWSLEVIAYAMSKAEGHVGVDSAFFHLAQLYMPMERIRIYHREKVSHHVERAKAHGAVCVRL